jgi:hypothetical protein
MTRLEQLTALRDAVRDGRTPTRFDITQAIERPESSEEVTWFRLALDRDMNAALELLAALLPGSLVHDMSQYPDEWHVTVACAIAPHYFSDKATDPARALTLAALEAMIAKGEG